MIQLRLKELRGNQEWMASPWCQRLSSEEWVTIIDHPSHQMFRESTLMSVESIVITYPTKLK